MRCPRSYLVNVIATGFVVLVLLSVSLFWGRSLCETMLRDIMPGEAKRIQIEPSGLVPEEIENDPNVVRRSGVHAGMRRADEAFALGTGDYFRARAPGGRHSNIYYYHHSRKDESILYFDEMTGLIGYRYSYEQKAPDETTVLKKAQLYAGPEGISETADKTLGRFIAPITDLTVGYMPMRIFFDKKLRRFFKIDFEEKTVLKGPEFAKDGFHNPVQIGELSKNRSVVDLDWIAPRIRASDASEEHIKKIKRFLTFWRRRYLLPFLFRKQISELSQYLLVLDESGRIDLLDKQILKFAGTAGYLPAPATLFPSRESVTPRDLLGYTVLPLAFEKDGKYRGMFVASVSREGTAMALTVFDEKGKLIKTEHTGTTEYSRTAAKHTPSGKAVFFKVPWAPVLTITKYLLENLQPPILSIASYFTADSFEAAAGHRALFILPNSFIAMKGREVGEKTVGGYMFALLLILPSIILGLLLAWQVSKDSTLVGLSEDAKLYWIIGTVAFGLCAYITYRLNRPKITLVTCVNCGNMRRPDMDRCHRCGSKWLVPELTPPSWRVIDR